jgi:carboxylesterase type B
MLGFFGCNNTANATEQIECLRSKPWLDIVTAPVASVSVKYFAIDWSPVLDGPLIPLDFWTRFKSGVITNRVPVMLGFDKDEGTIFIDEVPRNITEAGVNATILSLFGPQLTPAILSFYRYSQFQSPWLLLSEVIGDFFEACPTRRGANYISATGAPTFVFQWDHVLSTEVEWGAFHGSEIPFIFNLPDGFYGGIFNVSLSPEEQTFGRTFRRYVRNFGRSGDPNVPAATTTAADASLLAWPAYLNTTQSYLLSDLNFTTASQIRTVRCNFWEVAYPK